MNINDKLNLVAEGRGTTAGKLLIGTPEYVRQTVENMRSSVISQAQIALEVLKAGEETGKGSCMVRKIRNGVVIKIGYGPKNEILYDEDGNAIDERRFFEKDRADAIVYLETVISLIEEGVFNGALKAKLEDYRARSNKGKEARSKKKDASNIASISKAA